MARDENAQQRRMRAAFTRRAIETNAPLLAAAFNRYASFCGWTWQELAETLGISEDSLNRMACCAPPRSERFEEDLKEIAALGGVTADTLRSILARDAERRMPMAAEPSASYNTGD
jgi:predicted transcriptional regulator